METNNHQIVDYSAVLEAQYGALGTPERAKFDEEAYAFIRVKYFWMRERMPD